MAHRNFILLASPRTGSGYLSSLVNSHPNAVMLSEIFNFHHHHGKFLEDPAGWYSLHCNRNYPDHVQVVGAKILYGHATTNDFSCDFDGNVGPTYAIKAKMASSLRNAAGIRQLQEKFDTLWTQLKNDRNLFIVHLKRRNVLETVLSLRKAMISDQWLSTQEHKSARQIMLPYDFCIKYFKYIQFYEGVYDRLFFKSQVLDVYYEDLINTHRKVMERAQLFLGLPPVQLKSTFSKQSVLPVAEAIINYEELKSQFSGSSWEKYFCG